MRRKGLLVLSAALILIGTVTACALNFGKIKGMITGDDLSGDGEIIAYEYGTMEEYLAPAAGSPASLSSVTQHLVTVSADPSYGGSVTPSTYVVEGSTLTLNATANQGYAFKEWQDAAGATVSTSASFVTPPVKSDNIKYKAVFTPASYVVQTPLAAYGDTSIEPVSSSCEGGYATGGGTVLQTSGLVTLSAVCTDNTKYDFAGWYYWDAPTQQGLPLGGAVSPVYMKPTITIGDGGDYDLAKVNGRKIYARFIRNANNIDVLVSATLIPSMGNIDITSTASSTNPTISETGNSSVSVIVRKDTSHKPQSYVQWFFNLGTEAKPGSTEGGTQDQYVFRELIVEYDYNDSGSVKVARESKLYSNPPTIGARGSWKLDLTDKVPLTFLNVYVIYRPVSNANTEETHSLTTAAYPHDYGVTSGDMSSTQTFTGNVKATPNDGYLFDHWEWVVREWDTINSTDMSIKKTSTDNPLSIPVSGKVTCIAYFKKATYNVSISSIKPDAGGIVVSGLGPHAYGTDADVLITPFEGYEFVSCSYTTKDGITHTHDSSSFTIPDIKEDIWLNVEFKQTKFTVSAKPEPLGNESGSFNKVKISTGSTSVETTDTATTAEIPFTSEASVTLTATPNIAAGYKFDKWVGTDGATSTDNPYTPPSVTKDVTYIARFVKDKYTISVAEDPAGTGKAYVYDPSASGGEASNRLTTLEVTVGGQAKIAIDQQYKDDFLYWTTSTGTRLYESEITINDIRADESFTAHFKAPIELTVGHSPDGAAEVRMRKSDGSTIVDWSAGGSGKINTGDDIILEARSTNDDEYRFIKWQDGNGMTYTENPVKIVNVTATDTFTAIYESSKCKVSVNASPTDGGTAWVKGKSADFVQGFDEVDKGGSVTLRAVAESGHTFRYWEDGAGNRYTDPNVTIPSIGADTVFTAYFGQGEVNITVDVAPSEAGMVELNDNGYVSSSHTYQITGGSYITLSAQSNDNSKYKFNRWEDSKGNFYNDNPLTLIDVTADEKFTAIFTGTDKEEGITVKASPAAGGRVTKTKNDDDSITIKAQANKGYSYNGWYLNDKKLTESSTYKISSPHDGDVYVARFSRNKGYDAKSDITKEHFANVTRIFEAPNYTVTRETIQQMARTTVSADRARIGDPAPGSKDYGAYGSLKSYYEEKYSKEDDRSALLIDEMLVTTHSESVSCVTVEDASAEEKAAQFVLGKFGDRYKFRILTIKKIAATEEFISSPHTYLLKDTGASFQDNVFILYGSDNGRNSNSGITGYDWVTCVADEAGTLRFTVPRFESGDTFIVVLTWPE